MNVFAGASEQPLRSAPASSTRRRTLRLGRLAVYGACTALALLVNYLLGKEMAWDTLNYHLYAGLSAVHDRFAQDYFAAGPQAYANPYAYAPFYALISSGLPALLVASLLATVHSIILWLTFELALVALPSGKDARRFAFALCATALAAVNPVLLQQLGSSFADITTAELVLAGWLLLAQAVRTPCTIRVICAAPWGGNRIEDDQRSPCHRGCSAPLTSAGFARGEDSLRRALRDRNRCLFRIGSVALGVSALRKVRQSVLSAAEQYLPVAAVHNRAVTPSAIHSVKPGRSTLAPVCHAGPFLHGA
jgi:hypothetical protein